jgi:hypothetical protein
VISRREDFEGGVDLGVAPEKFEKLFFSPERIR